MHDEISKMKIKDFEKMMVQNLMQYMLKWEEMFVLVVCTSLPS